MRAFHAAGITSVTDALIGPADIALLEEARRRGALSMRVNMLLHYEHYDMLAARGWPGAAHVPRARAGGTAGRDHHGVHSQRE